MNLQTLIAKVLRRSRGSAITNSAIDPTSKIEPGSQVVGVTMGRHSYCGYDCTLLYSDIGSFCSIANRVSIGGARHPIEFLSTSPVFLSHKDSVKAKFARHDYLPVYRTRIGHDVWIGEACLIKAGVSIGNGAVIGMGAVVTRDVPDYAIVGGNPARLIRMRFEKPIVEALLRMKWWDYKDEDLGRIGEALQNPEQLLREEGFL